MPKEVRLNLDYLAKTYGMTILLDARVLIEDDGRFTIVLEGQGKDGE